LSECARQERTTNAVAERARADAAFAKLATVEVFSPLKHDSLNQDPYALQPTTLNSKRSPVRPESWNPTRRRRRRQARCCRGPAPRPYSRTVEVPPRRNIQPCPDPERTPLPRPSGRAPTPPPPSSLLSRSLPETLLLESQKYNLGSVSVYKKVSIIGQHASYSRTPTAPPSRARGECWTPSPRSPPLRSSNPNARGPR